MPGYDIQYPVFNYVSLFVEKPLSHCHFTFIYLFIWLRWVFVAVCGLSLVVVSGGYPFVAVRRLLIVVASLVAERGL